MKIDEIPVELTMIFDETEALKKGHFLLTSGLHSEYYLQCALALQYPQIAQKLCKEIANKIGSDTIDATFAPALGGIVIGYEMARALNCRAVFAERVDGNLTLRRGFQIAPGEKVLIVEDVITTGGSVMEVREIAKAAGADVKGFACLFDRSNGKFAPDEGLTSYAQIEVETFRHEECPLCEKGSKPVKPGSRTVPGQ